MADAPQSRRRFPAPWVAVEIPGGYQVQDARGVTVAWIYARDDMHARTGGERYLTTDEARRIAAGIVRLPELLAGVQPATRNSSEERRAGE